ncbi:MAG: OmpW family outer membrane protein [Bacteroidota bacterium]
MKKITFSIASLIFLSLVTYNIAFAQLEDISVGANAGLAIPIGDFASATKGGATMGFGGGLHAKRVVDEKLTVGLDFSYFSFGGTDIADPISSSSTKTTYSIIPISVFAQWYLTTEGFRPFVGLDLGYYMQTWKSDVTISGITLGKTATYNKVGVAAFVGGAYPINEQIDVFGDVKYHYITEAASGIGSFSFIGVEVGVDYKFGE